MLKLKENYRIRIWKENPAFGKIDGEILFLGLPQRGISLGKIAFQNK